jgi:hypothetical protein
VLFAKYNYNNQVKEDEMGRACSTHGENFIGKARRKEPTRKTKT